MLKNKPGAMFFTTRVLKAKALHQWILKSELPKFKNKTGYKVMIGHIFVLVVSS